jgi:hypothetical protein
VATSRTRIRRRGRWTSFAISIVAAVVLVTVLGGNALGSTVSSAAFTGGAGTVSVSGTLYVKSGGALTLTVTTSSDTKCVQITGAHTARQTSSTAKSSWTFNFTAGAGDGTQTVTAAASPNFNQNNCTGQSQSPQNASYVLDNTGPTVTAALSPAPNGAGWNNANVTVTWSALDSASGVGSGPTPASDSQTANTAGVTKTSTASDRLGNTADGSVTIKLDKAAPSISGNRNPGPNSNGWNNTDVLVSFSCSDAGASGIKSCTAPTTLSSETSASGQSVVGTAVDNADNSTTASVGPVKIDKTAPSLSGSPTTSPNAAGWYNGDVAIHWTCSDGLSGIDGSCPANFTISSEGTGLTASASVSDKAGNSASATSSPAVKIDKAAPVTNASAPPAWNNVDVTVDLNGSDGLSGVAATYYAIDGGPTQGYSPISKPSFSTEGVHSLEYWSVDNAGNEETHHTIPVQIDKTSPTIQALLSPLPNANGWNNGNVTVSFVCDDALSGIASCSADQVVSDEGASQPVSGTAEDNAGNSAEAHTSVSVDKTPPTISAAVDRPANANGWYDDDVIVSFTCGDGLSGIDTCPAAQTLGEGAAQSASGTAHDNAGNTASAGVSGIDVDKTAPELSGAATTDPNGNGWYQGDVAIHWTCSDALSGIDGSCPADDTLSGEGGNLSASASVHDLAGNAANASVSGIKIDRTAPVTLIDLPVPVVDDWYAGPVEVTLNASDNLSGVGATHYSIDGGGPQTYSGSFSFDQNGVHTIRFWSVDDADNVEDSSIPGHEATVKIDTVNPSISADRAPAANGFGWNNGPVTVTFNCADDDSGIRVAPPGCPDPVVLSGEGADQSADGTAYDRVGNHASAGVSGVNIDLTQPSLSGAATTAPNANGWYKDDVTVHWSTGDALSGVDPASVPGDSLVTGEGDNLDAGPVTVFDKAGNSRSASLSGIKIDRTAPVIDASPDRPANGNGWYKADVTVAFDCSDALSGIDTCPSPLVLGQGQNQSASGTAHDMAGNSASAGVSGINVDEDAPTITASAKNADNASYTPGSWTNQSVTVHFECSDALSGLDGNCPSDQTVSSSTATSGLTVSASVSDKAGNESTASLLVKVDKDAPSLTIGAPTNNSTFATASVQVLGTAADTPSGLQSLTVNGVPTGVAVNGSFSASVALACGSNTITALATDNAGNQTSTSVNVTRSCLWVSPALQPVATSNGSQGNPSATNLSVFKIKSTIPVKFQVYSDQAMTQLLTTPPAGSSAKLSFEKYDNTTDSGASVEVLASGNANTDNLFRWTGGPDYQYVYNLSTAGKAAGTYRARLTLYAGDGSMLGQSAWQYFVLRS